MVKSDWRLRPIYDVIAMMKGSEFPDQWIVRGNHHDGWVFGAEDPLSGQVALMAEAKAMGELAKTGWRPKRTLVYASWDAEEPGLMGSTEWAEEHAQELQAKAVIYVNSDNINRGFLDLEGSHELQTLANGVAADVTDPETRVDLLTRRRADLEVKGQEAAGGNAEAARTLAKAAASGGPLPIQALGSGSDYTPFLQHLGVPSLDVGFDGEGESGGVYHSAYDTHDHYVRFGDPGMAYSAVLAKTVGRITMRYADADLPPVDFTAFAATIAQYVEEVHKLADHAREETASRDRTIDSGAYRLTADPTKVQLPPERQELVPPRRLRPARPRQRPPDRERRPLPADLRLACADAGAGGGARPRRPGHRPRADESAGTAGPALVPKHDLCARHRDRLRRQDPAGGARGDRAAPLRPARRRHSRHGRGAERLRRPAGPGGRGGGGLTRRPRHPQGSRP